MLKNMQIPGGVEIELTYSHKLIPNAKLPVFTGVKNQAYILVIENFCITEPIF